MTAPLTVLVVDDDGDMRLLIRLMLEAAGDGIEVVAEAVDGEEAIEQFVRLSPPPHPAVVVLDNQMPGRSGVEVAELLLERLPHQPIVLFSAYLDDTVQEQARRLGIRCMAKTEIKQLPTLLAQLVGG